MFRSDMDDVCNCRRWCTEGNCACLFSCFQRLVSRVGWVNSSKFVLNRNLTVRGKCLPKLKPTFDTFGLVGFVFFGGGSHPPSKARTGLIVQYFYWFLSSICFPLRECGSIIRRDPSRGGHAEIMVVAGGGSNEIYSI